jgi:hypothetical protein
LPLTVRSPVCHRYVQIPDAAVVIVRPPDGAVRTIVVPSGRRMWRTQVAPDRLTPTAFDVQVRVASGRVSLTVRDI